MIINNIDEFLCRTPLLSGPPLHILLTCFLAEELGVGGANLASLFGKRRRKRQLFGGEDDSTSQTLGSALSTGAGLYG